MARSGKIEAIPLADVHRICSGQVVVDVATAAKELVENALDAGASKVEVRLRNYGLELLEVVDDGSGIAKVDYEALALKHWTSKLTTFEDLQTVHSFGFRGEALSSLCALSRVSVCTRTVEDATATLLTFNTEGKLVGQKPIAREKGTTVSCENLFETLPVRAKEFQKHIKREYAKLLNLLQAYALIATSVKFKLITLTKNGRSTVFATEGTGNMKDAITALFGSQQTAKLDTIDTVLQNQEKKFDVRLTGFISRPMSTPGVGNGRSSSDRQYFFINDRPVELPKVARVINETYRQFNASNGFPVVFICLHLDTRRYDVNVTPDKRTIFISDEKDVLLMLKDFISKLYEPLQFTFAVRSMSDFLPPSQAPLPIDATQAETAPLLGPDPANLSEDEPDEMETSRKTPKLEVEEASQKSVGVRGHVEVVEVEHDCKDHSPREVEASSSLKRKRSEGASSAPVAVETVRGASEYLPEDLVVPVDSSLLCERFVQLMDESSISDTRTRTADQRKMRLVRSGLDEETKEEAETYLQRVVSKQDFLDMQVIGQFNLGFIICQLKQDLFIVDQHASDEKYRFETLQQTTKIQSQQLFKPLKLDLSAVQEVLVTEHLDVFRRNGFEIQVTDAGTSDADETKKQQLHLVSLPYSKNTVFGVEDISELCALLAENPGLEPRLPKIRAMFASRACRSAIMIGRPLNHFEMKRVLQHMAQLDQPWNCPHGRPTMRHLVDLTTTNTEMPRYGSEQPSSSSLSAQLVVNEESMSN